MTLIWVFEAILQIRQQVGNTDWGARRKPKCPYTLQTNVYVQVVPDGKCLFPDRSRQKISMSRAFQTKNLSRTSKMESFYVQTASDGRLLCPDHYRRKVSLSRLSQQENYCFLKIPYERCLFPDRSRRKICSERQDGKFLCPDRFTRKLCPESPRWKVSVSRPLETEGFYIQTTPDGKFFIQIAPDGRFLCPDHSIWKMCPERPRWKVFMSIPLQTEGFVCLHLSRRKVSTSRLSQKENCCFLKIPYGWCLFPDRSRRKICPASPRWKVSMSIPLQTESVFVKIVPEVKLLFPENPIRKVSISRSLQTENMFRTSRWKVSMSRSLHTEIMSRKSEMESFCVQAAWDGRLLYPDHSRRKVFLSRSLQMEDFYAQTTPYGKCVQNVQDGKFLCPYPFKLKVLYVYTSLEGKCLRPDCPRRKIAVSWRSHTDGVYFQIAPDENMFRTSEMENFYVQTASDRKYVQKVRDGKFLSPDRMRRKVSISRPLQMESVYIQIAPDRRFQCPEHSKWKMCPESPRWKVFSSILLDAHQDHPNWNLSVPDRPCWKCLRSDHPRWKETISRPSQMECAYVQTFVCSFSDFRAFMFRFQWVPRCKIERSTRMCSFWKCFISSAALTWEVLITKNTWNLNVICKIVLPGCHMSDCSQLEFIWRQRYLVFEKYIALLTSYINHLYLSAKDKIIYK